MKITHGKRIATPPTEWEEGHQPMQPGDYWKDSLGRWSGITPNDLLAGLNNHHVEEHEDGTITVSPSILTKNGITEWHGYIKKGVWEDC